MKKTAFRIIPGRQPGLFRTQFGKRVFWVFWQWYDIKKTPVCLSDAAVALWNNAAEFERVNATWKAAVSGSIKP